MKRTIFIVCTWAIYFPFNGIHNIVSNFISRLPLQLHPGYMVLLAGHIVTGIVERDLLWRNLDEMQFYLRILEKNSAKESYVYKLVLDFHEMTFTGVLFQLVKNTAYRIQGMAEWLEKSCLLAFWEGTQALTPRKAENLSYGRLMWFNTQLVDNFSTFRGKRWRYEAASTASFNIQIGWDRT
jgi:hypothetical protein